MRCVVVGAGAWGLPAATELVRRGHQVELVDRHGPANTLSSSPGPTRIWRLSHPDRLRVRLALRGIEAMERLNARSGMDTFLRRGLLWRDDVTVGEVAASLAAEGVEHELVPATDVGTYFPGLRPDGRDAVWQNDAGPVLAAVSLAAQRSLFESGGGNLRSGVAVEGVERTSGGVAVHLAHGGVLDADSVVLAPGPGAEGLLQTLGIDLPLRPRLEQVVHFGDPADLSATDWLPCLFEGPVGDEPAMYAMPTPGVGYKVGLDEALRDLVDGDDDRTPDPVLLDRATARVRRDLTSVVPTPLDAQVCCWTEPPDNRFIIDRLDGGVVVACGDGGEGFKFSALMGEVIADLAEDRPADPDVATFGLSRFADGITVTPHVLGR